MGLDWSGLSDRVFGKRLRDMSVVEIEKDIRVMNFNKWFYLFFSGLALVVGCFDLWLHGFSIINTLLFFGCVVMFLFCFMAVFEVVVYKFELRLRILEGRFD